MRWWHRDLPRRLVATAPALPALLLTWLTYRGLDPVQLRVLARVTSRRRWTDRLFAHSPEQTPQLAAGVALVAVVSVLPRARELGVHLHRGHRRHARDDVHRDLTARVGSSADGDRHGAGCG